MRRSQSVYLNRDRFRENWREYEDRRKISDLDDDKKKTKSRQITVLTSQANIIEVYLSSNERNIRRTKIAQSTRALHITQLLPIKRRCDANCAVNKKKRKKQQNQERRSVRIEGLKICRIAYENSLRERTTVREWLTIRFKIGFRSMYRGNLDDQRAGSNDVTRREKHVDDEITLVTLVPSAQLVLFVEKRKRTRLVTNTKSSKRRCSTYPPSIRLIN